MPAKFGMIAALHGDLDTSDGVGKVYFRQGSGPELLRQAAEHINRAFPEDDEVEIIHAVVVTWVDVAAHEPHPRGDDVEKKVRVMSIQQINRRNKTQATVYWNRDLTVE